MVKSMIMKIPYVIMIDIPDVNKFVSILQVLVS